MKQNRIASAVGAALLFAAAVDARAVTWQAGDWTLGLGGNVNAFYTWTICDSGKLDSGGTTLAGLVCPTEGDKHSVNNGLLPASLNFSAETTQNGIDLGAHINVYYGITSQGDGGSDALAFSTVDARQVYLTFGTEQLGTVKMGRDFGLFGYDAIINDMSLLGAGVAFTAADPGHTTLGGLGFGYVYTDRLAQIDWISPKWSGFQGTLGIFNPLDGLVDNGDQAKGESSPGWHLKASYDWDGTVPGYLSATYIRQNIDVPTGGTSAIKGWDMFGKLSYKGFGLAGYYYSGEGMSSLALGGLVFPGFAADGRAEKTDGYYFQGTYTWNNTKFGVHYGESKQKEVTPVDNQRLTFGIYHNLTPSLTLLAEYNMEESKLDTATATGKDETSSFNIGAILLF